MLYNIIPDWHSDRPASIQHPPELLRKHTAHGTIFIIIGAYSITQTYSHQILILSGSHFWFSELESPDNTNSTAALEPVWPFNYKSYALTNCAVTAIWNWSLSFKVRIPADLLPTGFKNRNTAAMPCLVWIWFATESQI